MYCPKCGVKLTEKAVFCHACGVKLPKELTDSEYKIEDYDSLFVHAPEKQEQKKATDFFKFTIADNNSSVEDNIEFSVPDDWEPLGEAKPRLTFDERDYSEDDLNFTILENRDE